MDVADTLNRAILAAKAGRRAEARRLLESVLNVDERNEQAWLWLSGVVEDDEERLICLENVLIINPHNRAARRGLAALQKERAAGQSAPGDELPGAHEISPASQEPQVSGFQSGLRLEPPAPSASPVRRSADNRVFIVITIVLALLLICTVISIVAYVVLAPSG